MIPAKNTFKQNCKPPFFLQKLNCEGFQLKTTESSEFPAKNHSTATTKHIYQSQTNQTPVF